MVFELMSRHDRESWLKRSARPLLYIHDVPSRWFVDGADDCACDCELDYRAGDPAAKDFKR